MKKILSYILICLLAVACFNKNKTVIKGELSNADPNEVIFLHELTTDGVVTIDSTSVSKSGRVKFHLEHENPGFYQLKSLSGSSLSLAIIPGEQIHITANMKDFYKSKTIFGSPNSERINILHDSLRNAVAQLRFIEGLYADINEHTPESNYRKDSLVEQYKVIRANHHKYTTGFIIEDLKALANVAALYQEYEPNNYVFNKSTDLQYFKLAADTLSKYYPNVTMVKKLRNNFNLMLSTYNTQQIIASNPHTELGVKNLNFPDNSGKNNSMFKDGNKLTLLSFWDINDKVCIENNLVLKSIYSKYKHKGFEIYQVAIGPKPDEWLKTILFEDYGWISVYDTAYPNSASLTFYNVTNVPTNYLIDQENDEILSKNLQPKALDNTLNYMLN